MDSEVLFQRQISGSVLLDERVYPPGMTMPMHQDGVSRVSMTLGGAWTETTPAGEAVTCEPFDVVLKPADAAHANSFGFQGARVFSVVLLRAPDADLLYRWVNDGAAISALLSLRALAHQPSRCASASELTRRLTLAALRGSECDAVAPPAWTKGVAGRIASVFTLPSRAPCARKPESK